MAASATATEAELLLELQELHRECDGLNRRIELAGLSKRFSSEPQEAERAADQEQKWLKVLDRTMSQLRAVEACLRNTKHRASSLP